MKYDFSKCNNLQFKAKVQGIERKGYLKVLNEENVYMFYSDGEKAFDTSLQLEYTLCNKAFANIMDFTLWAEKHGLEIIPRDPETYKDWKVGDSIMGKSNNDKFVIKAILNDLIFASSTIVAATALLQSKYIGENYKLVLTDYEQEILKAQDEKKAKECPFRKGDRVLVRDEDEDAWIFETFDSYEGGNEYPYDCKEDVHKQCIPYNEKTWKLLGTTDEYKEE